MFPFVEGSLVKAICSKFSKLILLNEYLAAVHVIEMVTVASFHSSAASIIPSPWQTRDSRYKPIYEGYGWHSRLMAWYWLWGYCTARMKLPLMARGYLLLPALHWKAGLPRWPESPFQCHCSDLARRKSQNPSGSRDSASVTFISCSRPDRLSSVSPEVHRG